MVISDLGIVATSQTLASQAGAQILARGGSVMDAAIAANGSAANARAVARRIPHYSGPAKVGRNPGRNPLVRGIGVKIRFYLNKVSC